MTGNGGRRPSIRRTLLLYLGLLSLAGIVAMFFLARSYGERAADRSYDHLLVSSVLSIADSVARVDQQWQVDLPYAALNLLSMAPEDRVFYRVADRGGALVTGYADLPSPPKAPVLDGEPVLFDADYSGERVRFAAVLRRMSSPSEQAQALVQVGQTRRARDALADDMVLRTLGVIGALSLLTMLLSWLGVWQATRPLIRVERDLSRREPSDLRPIQGEMPREMDQMVAALNRFMERLSSNNETLRAFIAEAAHQMRTPLAALRAQAQLALDEEDIGEKQRSLQAIDRNASLMSRLLNQLLSDASVTHRSSLQRFETLDLAEILHEAIYEATPRVDPQPRVKMAGTAEGARVKGDPLLLREALKNLIDNAFKYGRPERGPVQLALTVDATHCVVTVADHGPGIAPAEANRVFERFIRGEGAAAGGAGLGLAIVKRVADSHRGAISLANRIGGGLIVTLKLPRLPA